MDESTARWLTSPDAAGALALAAEQDDPTSLAAAQQLRRLVAPERAAAAAEQEWLRRRGAKKLGERARGLFLTRDGLEQATRPGVAARRAARLVALGASEVVDLTCGLGLDALAFAEAGLRVSAVELDPVTAVFASANLGEGVRVIEGDAAVAADALLAGGAAAFIDPSRRTASGRTWRVEDLTPSWDFVTGLLVGQACVKLGPGFPLGLLPDGVEAEWVSDAGDVVECALWSGPGTIHGRRRAVVDGAELARDHALEAPEVGSVDAFVYEPDGAVIRAGLVPAVAEAVGAHRLHDGVAYLTGPRLVRTPFADAFAVAEVLPYSEKVLRAWVRDRGVGILEIKKRGVDADPAALRKRLRPSGPNSATLLLTPTASGTVVLVVRRVEP